MGHWQWVRTQVPWAASPPSCPYPTTNWARLPNGPTRKQGILGPPPSQQLYMAQVPQGSYVPTDIECVMHTMSLNPPDRNWYMDIGATSHMTSPNDNLLSYFI